MNWKNPAIPRHVVQMIPVDLTRKFLVMHRSNNVRSARNCWSFPSGMHDIGETIKQCAVRELKEEYGLNTLKYQNLGVYENIAPDKDAKEQYHWVITLGTCIVEDVTKAENKEPEKHDKMEFTNLDDFMSSDWWDNHQFHESFMTAIRPQFFHLFRKIDDAINNYGQHVEKSS